MEDYSRSHPWVFISPTQIIIKKKKENNFLNKFIYTTAGLIKISMSLLTINDNKSSKTFYIYILKLQCFVTKVISYQKNIFSAGFHIQNNNKKKVLTKIKKNKNFHGFV